tara:strand:- start:325 stop:1674 length:1350 start_codon:yes stop_codon:yes gene_type:complete
MAVKPLVLVQAPVATRSGYGNHSRDIVKSLIKMDKFDIKIASLRWGQCPMNALDQNNPEDKEIIDRILTSPLKRQPDVNIDIRVPNEFQRVGKYNIGITAGMETTLISKEWVDGLNRADLIIVPSEHSKNVFKASNYSKVNNQTQQVEGELKVEKPIEVLFEGADVDIYKKTDTIPKELDSTLNTIKEDFCFLYVGHWLRGSLGQDRKDTGMLVKTFLETFKNKQNAPALILKTSGATFSIIDRDEIMGKIDNIKSTIQNAKTIPNIYLVHGDLTDEEMNGLYNHPKVKAHVSFTKGEGFGRPLLEASISQKPVIASAWSGQLDFLDGNLSVLLPGQLTDVHESAVWDKVILKESKWFTVNYQMASKILMDVWSNLGKFEMKAKKQGLKNSEHFTLDKMKEKFETMLDNYLPEFAQEVKIKLPKMVIPSNDKIKTEVTKNETANATTSI